MVGKRFGQNVVKTYGRVRTTRSEPSLIYYCRPILRISAGRGDIQDAPPKGRRHQLCVTSRRYHGSKTHSLIDVTDVRVTPRLLPRPSFSHHHLPVLPQYVYHFPSARITSQIHQQRCPHRQRPPCKSASIREHNLTYTHILSRYIDICRCMHALQCASACR